MPRTKKKTKKNKEEKPEKVVNTYEDYVSTFVEGFVSKLFSDGILKVVKKSDLQRWLANYDENFEKVNDLMNYYYIADGTIFQLYDLVTILPTFNYKLNSYDITNQNEKYLSICTRILNKINYKKITRDLLSQEVSNGTVVCMWMGNKKKPYLFIFDNLKYVYPAYTLNGEWIAQVDLEWFTTMEDKERNQYFKNLSPYVTSKKYETYIQNNKQDEYRYIDLPQDKTTVLRTHTLKRNQRLGIPWGTAALFDMMHKQKMKDLETAISNKIINAIAVLKIGSESNEQLSNLKLNKNVKKKIYNGVKSALEKNVTDGITCIAIPEFTSLNFPKFNSDGLDAKKYDGVNNDITSANGVSQALLNGSGANFSSAKINLTVFYQRVGVLLSDIENEVFGKLFNIILPNTVSDEYYMTFDKLEPLTNKDKMDILFKLHNMEGFSLKHILDRIDDVDFQQYVEQSIYEQEKLKLQEKIKPYSSSYTGGSDSNPGAPANDNPDNESTIETKTTDGNSLPD